MFRSQLHALCDETSVYRQKKGLLRQADLEREDVQSLETFYKESYFYPYLLNYQDTLKNVSDMGDLWYREFYLELTKCVQFPIEMSLPWILVELVIGIICILLVLLCFVMLFLLVIYLFVDLSLFCTYAVLAGLLGDRFCNPHVVIFLF
jgi:hypothetical protein